MGFLFLILDLYRVIFLPVGEYLGIEQVVFIVRFLGQVYTNWICFLCDLFTDWDPMGFIEIFTTIWENIVATFSKHLFSKSKL